LVQKNDEYLSYLVDMDVSEVLPGVIPVLEYLKTKQPKNPFRFCK
jgi:beta-phosphoglucomutase